MAGNLEIKNANGKTVTLKNPDTNVSDIVVDLADNASKTYVTSVNKKRRNYLINGNFQFWDYATSQTTNGYGSDNRWNNSNNGSTKTHSRMTSGDTERALFESPYYSRTIATYVSGTNSFVKKVQTIEDFTKLAGKTVTLSFWARANSNKKMNLQLVDFYGTGGTPSTNGTSTTNFGNIDLTSTWTKYKATGTLPSLIGKTLGTDGVHTSGFRLDFGFTFSPDRPEVTLSGMPIGQSGTFDIAEVKLEEGSIATDGWSPYDGEWGSEAIARQRYYQLVSLGDQGYNAVNATAAMRVPISTVMRTAPTVVVTDANGGGVIAGVHTYFLIHSITTAGAFSYYITAGLSAEL